MRFYTQQHRYYCGIDLHARTMYLCVLNQEGEIVLHRNMPSTSESFLKAVAPYRDDVAVAVECIFTWYWLADVCAKENIPFVLGHALYMKAIHGGKAKNDKIDAHKIAVLLRGGMIPMAYVYPAGMRSTRDLLRRRMHLMHKRSELLVHIQNTNSQYCLPQFQKKIAYKKNREGVAEHFPDLSVRKSMEMDLALIDHYDKLLTDVELYITKTAKIHDIERFSTVQDFVSYCRLVKCSKESAGKHYGFSGAKIGNVHLKWAFSEASVLFLRQNPEAKRYLDKLTSKHGKAKALSILAQRLGRAVYYMLKRDKAFDMKKFFSS